MEFDFQVCGEAQEQTASCLEWFSGLMKVKSKPKQKFKTTHHPVSSDKTPAVWNLGSFCSSGDLTWLNRGGRHLGIPDHSVSAVSLSPKLPIAFIPHSPICESLFSANAPPLRSIQTNVCANHPQITVTVHPESGDSLLRASQGLKWLLSAGFATSCYSKASLVSPTKAYASRQMEGTMWRIT